MKISELPLTTSVAGNEVLPIVQDSATKKVTINDVVSLVDTGVTDLNSLSGSLNITSNDSSVTIDANGNEIDLSVAAVGGVSEINGLTGGLSIISNDSTINIDSIGSTIDLSIAERGVIQLNSLDGNLNITSNDNSVVINASGTEIDLSVSGGGGGGGTNPTPNFIPYNDGGTFADSYLNQGNVLLETIFEGENWGFKIDLNDGSLKLGDFNNINLGTKLIVSDSITNQYISTLWGGFNLGFKLDYTNNVYSFGDFETNIGGRCIIIDDDNKIIQTKSDGSDIGFKFDFDASLTSFIPSATSNTRLFLGSLGGVEVLTLQDADGVEYGININKSSGYMQFGDWNTYGCNIFLDTLANRFDINAGDFYIFTGASGFHSTGAVSKLGDFDGNINGTYWGIDDDQKCILASNQLLTGGSHSTSGQHLKIKIGGTNYVIELKNA